jgi:hypothetical protein
MTMLRMQILTPGCIGSHKLFNFPRVASEKHLLLDQLQ